MNKRKFSSKWISSRLGAFPSPWSSKHYRLTFVLPSEIAKIPPEYLELLDYAPTEDWPNQGNIGSCTGFSGSIAMEITNTLLKLHATKERQSSLLQYIKTDLSAGWVYYWARIYAEIPQDLEGATNLGVLKALNKIGVATESEVPTDTEAPWDGIKYTPDILRGAGRFAINSYWNINPNPDDIRAAIYGLTHNMPYKMPDGTQGKAPLIAAYPIYSSFKEGYDDGIVPVPKNGDRFLGGHSSVIIGWKKIDDENYFVNFNSWGNEVGDNGLFYLPENYPFYPGDFWLIHNGPPSKQSLFDRVRFLFNRMRGKF